MYGDPAGVDGFDEGIIFLVGDDKRSMPSCASVQHAEYGVFVDEQEVALDLLVENICKLNTASAAGAKLGPLPAYGACVDDFRYQVKNTVCYANTLQTSFHGVLRIMPPPHM